jgi:5'-3' exonuclease
MYTEYDFVLLDMHNLCWRNWSVLNSPSPGRDDRRTRAIHKPLLYGLMRDLVMLYRMFECPYFVFCFDCKPYARADLFPEYKKGKPEHPDHDKVEKQIKDLYDFLQKEDGFFMSNVFKYGGYEADDVIGYIVKNVLKEERLLIVSGDRDFGQLIDERVDVYSPSTKMVITPEKYTDMHGYGPSDHVRAAAAIGEPGDNIPGVRGVGPVIAQQYIHGTVKSDLIKSRLLTADKLILKNIELITIPYPKLPGPQPYPKIVYEQMSRKVWNRVVEGHEYTNLMGPDKCPYRS